MAVPEAIPIFNWYHFEAKKVVSGLWAIISKLDLLKFESSNNNTEYDDKYW